MSQKIKPSPKQKPHLFGWKLGSSNRQATGRIEIGPCGSLKNATSIPYRVRKDPHSKDWLVMRCANRNFQVVAIAPRPVSEIICSLLNEEFEPFSERLGMVQDKVAAVHREVEKLKKGQTQSW